MWKKNFQTQASFPKVLTESVSAPHNLSDTLFCFL